MTPGWRTMGGGRGRGDAPELARFRVVSTGGARGVVLEVASGHGVAAGGVPIERLTVPLPDGVGQVEVGDEFALVRVRRGREGDGR